MTRPVDPAAAPVRRRRRRLLWVLLPVLAALAVTWCTPALFVPVAMRLAYLVTGVRTAQVQVDGHAWDYIEAGDAAATPALLLHGFGTSREAMLGLMPWLSPSHHAVAPDLPGFGRHAYHEGQTHDADFYVQIGRAHV